jgi:hypothetical protein
MQPALHGGTPGNGSINGSGGYTAPLARAGVQPASHGGTPGNGSDGYTASLARAGAQPASHGGTPGNGSSNGSDGYTAPLARAGVQHASHGGTPGNGSRGMQPALHGGTPGNGSINGSGGYTSTLARAGVQPASHGGTPGNGSRNGSDGCTILLAQVGAGALPASHGGTPGNGSDSYTATAATATPPRSPAPACGLPVRNANGKQVRVTKVTDENIADTGTKALGPTKTQLHRPNKGVQAPPANIQILGNAIVAATNYLANETQKCHADRERRPNG